mmetsp:Transcript_38989/g.39407  ORF Transcript_38989/g.39407 Transcript_38989/m.39407 type:complete len:109 (-) Transcript_38989:362-688(-)
MEAGLNDRYYDFPTNLGFMHPSEPLSSVAMKGLQWLWLRVFLVGDTPAYVPLPFRLADTSARCPDCRTNHVNPNVLGRTTNRIECGICAEKTFRNIMFPMVIVTVGFA